MKNIDHNLKRSSPGGENVSSGQLAVNNLDVLLLLDPAEVNALQPMLEKCGLNCHLLAPADAGFKDRIQQLLARSGVIVFAEKLIPLAEQFSQWAPGCAQIMYCPAGTTENIDPQRHYAQPFTRLTEPDESAIHTALEISHYKAQLRVRHLPALQLQYSALSCLGDILIFLSDKGNVSALNPKAAEVFGVEPESIIGKPWYNLIQTRRDLSAQHTEQFISAAIKTRAVTKIHPIAIATANMSSQLMDGIVGPVREGPYQNGVVLILRLLTSLEHLPVSLESKDGKQRQVSANLVSGILLFSPDLLNKINLRYGHRIGDRILFEIGELLHDLLRPTDLTAHYGGAIFLVMFSETTSAQTENLVNELRKKLLDRKYTQEQVSLTFSFGLALNNDLVTYSPVELFYYANFSLSQAQELGGDQIRQWRQRLALQQIGNLDRLSGNFSDTGSSDYQKMLLLWNMLNNLESVPDREEFIAQLLSQLCIGLELAKVAFFSVSSMQLTAEAAIDDKRRPLDCNLIRLSPNQQSYVDDIVSGKQAEPVFTSLLAESGTEVLLPVFANKRFVAMLWMAVDSDHAITTKDHHLLINIADFIALKLERLKATSKQPEKTSIHPASGSDFNFWYASEVMQRQLEYVKMVAPTNATILITGESGTGKEMLAKSIHQASDRKDKPFVIFDCGAVVESLIESELFGHTKGAFTGATSNKSGSIQEAHGGTIFLDEIGELPIETQVKLLRFVQEKQYAPVGSNQFKKVDVRVVAATNVDLEQRIKQGLFRQDLYYRLNVFKLDSIPLRERQDDILLLAQNYLSLYSQEYNKDIQGFSEEARQALLQYPWPGNVRELKNLVHRAVVLCSDELMQCNHLGLYPQNNAATHTNPVVQPVSVSPGTQPDLSAGQPEQAPVEEPDNQRVVILSDAEDGGPAISRIADNGQAPATPEFTTTPAQITHTQGVQQATPPQQPPASSTELKPPNADSSVTPTNSNTYNAVSPENSDSLETLCEGLIASCLHQGNGALPPIALHLEYLLYHDSLEQAQGVALQAANILNIAESTFRRRWKKLQQLQFPDIPQLSSTGAQIITQLLDQDTLSSRITVMQQSLAVAIQSQHLPVKQGCQLMDMSAPTYRKLLATVNER